MSETMIEKVALALWLRAAGRASALSEWGTMLAIDRASYLAEAETAIEAMREPDDAMRLASKRYKRKAKVYSGPECYRQMISAALSQASNGEK